MIGNVGAQMATPYAAQDPSVNPKAQDGSKKQSGTEQLTTVQTHCKEDHYHTQRCPHTVSTRTVKVEGESAGNAPSGAAYNSRAERTNPQTDEETGSKLDTYA